MEVRQLEASQYAGTLDELKRNGRLVVRGSHRPVLLIHDGDRVYALDNRCPHMGFPLERGSVEDGILTCHWHHARFDLASGCTFDLWADDVPTCPVEIARRRDLGQARASATPSPVPIGGSGSRTAWPTISAL